MPASPSHPATPQKPRHRRIDGRAQAVYPSFRLDSPIGSLQPGYARHVGRIGALAVALGVGVALATGGGAGVARADDGASDSVGGSAAGSQANTSPSGSAGTTTDASTTAPAPSTTTTSTTSTTGSDGPSSGPTVPDMKVSASGGANTSVGDDEPTAGTGQAPAVPAATATTEPTPTEVLAKQPVDTPDPAPKRPRATTAQVPSEDSAPTPTSTSSVSGVVRDEASAPVVKLAAATSPEIVPEQAASTSSSMGDVSEPAAAEALPTLAATALASVLAPLGVPGPAAPVQSPLLWAVLAWTRRESQSEMAATATAAYNDIYSTTLDTSVSGSVLTNDTAPQGDSLVVDSHTDPSHGTVTMAADGTFTYQPDRGYLGPDEFEYTARNVNDGTTTGTVVSIAVLAPNYPPKAVDDSFSAVSGQPVTSFVTLNDSDPEGESFVVVAHTDPANGTVSIGNTGLFTYLSDSSFVGTDSFTYTIADARGQASTATVTVTVVARGTTPPPVAGNDSVYTPLDASVSIPLLGNDFGFSGNALTVALGTPPQSGIVLDDGNGTVTYTPSTGFVGIDTFTYSIDDGAGGTATATVTISVGRLFNDPLVGRDYYDATQDTPLAVTAQWGVLSNDFDLDDDALTASVAGQPRNGSVVMAADGSFVYTPKAGFVGTDVFTYTATDSTNAFKTTTVTVTVKVPPNLPPVAGMGTYATNANTSITFDPLENASDPEGKPLTLSIVTKPTSGQLTGNLDGTFTYTPAKDFTGFVTFGYTVSDGVNQSAGEVVITVLAVNRPPVAKDDAVTFPSGQQVIIDVLANDYDLDGDDIYVSDYGTPAHGSTSGYIGGAIEYTPDADFYGTDTFTYAITDGVGTSTGTVTVTIRPPNKAPTANADVATTTMDTSIDINVLANDADPDGDHLVVQPDQPDYGTVTVDEAGVLHYTPKTGWTGTDWLNYTITDQGGLTDYASVKITVTGKDDGGTPSVPDGKWFTVRQDSTLSMIVGYGVLGQQELLEGVAAGLIDGPAHGSLQLNKDGSFTYTPTRGFVGTDTFTYSYGTSEWGDGPFTATIEVTPSAGLSLATTGGGAQPSCQSTWWPGQHGPDEVWPLCTYPVVRRLSDRL